jgi:hypothetical protein
MHSTLQLILGLLVWVPAALLVNVMHGPWFGSKGQFLAALGPLLALVVPGLLHGERGRNLLVWALALGPLLLLVGSIVASLVHIYVFRAYSPIAGPAVALAICLLPAWFIYWAVERSNRGRGGDA